MRPNSSRSSFIASDSATQRGVGRRTAGDALFGGGPCLADGGGIHVGVGGRAGRGDPSGGAPRHRALGHPHQDVLDETADDRRVEADLRDAESGFGGDSLEMRDIPQRIEMIGLAQVFLPQVDQVPALELFRGAG